MKTILLALVLLIGCDNSEPQQTSWHEIAEQKWVDDDINCALHGDCITAVDEATGEK